jgi:hypothetical protein
LRRFDGISALPEIRAIFVKNAGGYVGRKRRRSKAWQERTVASAAI